MRHLHLRSTSNLRNEALLVFKKFSIYGDMSQDEYERMTNPNSNEMMEDAFDEDINDTSISNYHILNFYLDCSYWHEQEKEIKESPLILPVQIVDVDDEEEVVEKYKVRNLPTLILVDGEGTEIHRWVGVTPTCEINSYIINNGYSSSNNVEKTGENGAMDLSGIPVEFRDKMNDSDFQDKVIAILAEGGTEEQIREKVDYLLGKKNSDEITTLEERVRSYLRDKFDTVGNLIIRESDSFDIIHKIKATTMLSKLNDDLDGSVVFPDVERIKEASNRVGISWNLIKSEEYKRALLIYRDGKLVD